MCARKVGNAFQTKQGNRTSCRDQEGRRVSDEVVPGTSVISSSETGMSGNFWQSELSFKKENYKSVKNLRSKGAWAENIKLVSK